MMSCQTSGCREAFVVVVVAQMIQNWLAAYSSLRVTFL